MLLISLVIFIVLLFGAFFWNTRKETWNTYTFELYDSNDRYLGTVKTISPYDKYRAIELMRSKYHSSFIQTEKGYMDKSLISKVV